MSSLRHEDREGWQAFAACQGKTSAVFYPPFSSEDRSARRSREARAKAVCALCPVRVDCLAHAFEHDERFGIWGGLTGRERRMRTATTSAS